MVIPLTSTAKHGHPHHRGAKLPGRPSGHTKGTDSLVRGR
jgi:hypothetical protein